MGSLIDETQAVRYAFGRVMALDQDRIDTFLRFADHADRDLITKLAARLQELSQSMELGNVMKRGV